MAEFTMVTTDDALTYTNTEGAAIIFEPENNNQESDTQGFQHKIQKGRFRNRVRVQIRITSAVLENTILPIIEYPKAVTCTFDRNIPLRTTATGIFNIVASSTLQEFEGPEYDYEIELVEIIEA
jgi:hypothetical protein